MKHAWLAITLAAAACSAPAGRTGATRSVPTAEDKQPRLVVMLVFDQWPQWALEVKRPSLPKGFARLLSEGEWRVGEFPSMANVTAAGHALLGSGEPPARTGIVSNKWWSRTENRLVEAAVAADGSITSSYLRVAGLGDSIAATNTGAKAVAIALKVRAARMPLGHHGLAIYYEGDTGQWKTHGQPTPAWFTSYTGANPVRLAPWTPLDPARLAQLSGSVDAQPGEVGEKGLGPTFPHDPSTTKKPFNAVFAMPLGNDIVFDMAAAAIEGERLGADTSPDLLIVSLSAHDYIAHGWGHESWEAWDAELRLDERLDAFLTTLDDRIGRGRWAMVATSDHGGSPMPELSGGSRYTQEQLMRAANTAASLNLGTGTWIASASFPYIYFTAAAMAANKKELETAYRKVIFALRALPGLGIVDRTEAFAGGCEQRTGDARLICLGIDLQRSGEIFYSPAPGWIIDEDEERRATGHRSLNEYDRKVPVILMPVGRTPHAPLTAPSGTMPMTDVAPLVAGWLGVPAPATLRVPKNL